MITTRIAAAVTIVAALSFATACATPLNLPPSHDAAWNTARANIVAASTTPVERIVLASGIAIREDVSLRDGTIDVDLEPPRGSQFAGIAFRLGSAADYEIVYLRGDGGRWAEVQYQPVFEGETTWQLYPGVEYSADLPVTVSPPGAPTHVTIVFAGTRADVYLNHSAEPVLRVVELKRAVRAGHVGIWAGGGAGTWSTFANLSAVARVDRTPVPMAMTSPLPGQIMRWRVSRRLASPDSIVAPAELTAAHLFALRSGVVADAETDGLMNLSRIVGNPAGPQVENVFGGAGWGLALAGATLIATDAHSARLRFGYSEGITIFLNGRRVHAGTHPYASPDLGRVSADANVVELPLVRGANELVLAVTDRAFGWGFRARLDDDQKVAFGVP